MYTTAYKTKKVTIEQYERLYFFGYFDVKMCTITINGDW